MPAQKSGKLVKPAKPVANKLIKPVVPAKAKLKVVKTDPKPQAKPPAKSAMKVKPVPQTKSPAKHSEKATAKDEVKKNAKVAADEVVKKKPGRPPKAQLAESAELTKTGAKRGRKPKNALEAKAAEDLDLSDIEEDLVGEPVAETTEKVKPLRMKISKAKERALMKEFGLDEAILTEEEMLKRRQRLKTLIKLGKTRGYLTHAEITDHLPEKLVDAETLEVVVSMLNDMGVAVYEQTPDAETLLLTNTGPTAATEEEDEEEAEAALSTVDSEFGRTTDPVRMYMREMGTVELLTREGEIEIAKRIEGGLQAMMLAISESPTTIAEILSMADKIAAGETPISDVVDGFVSEDEADDYVAEEDVDFFDEEDDDDGQGGSKALTRKLEELKTQALTRFGELRSHFERMRRAYEKEGYKSTAYNKAQLAVSAEITSIRFTVKTIERLCQILRSQVDDIRRYERELRKIVVDKCGMPQDHFIKTFPPNALNLKWAEKEIALGKAYSAVLTRNLPPIQDLQQK